MVESVEAEQAQQMSDDPKGDDNGTTDTEKLEEKKTNSQENEAEEPAQTKTEEIVQDVENTSQEANSNQNESELGETQEAPKEEQEPMEENEEDNQKEKILKGILKHERTYSNKHVDFINDVALIPFDETKDYTAEIQFVKELPKKVKSYREIFLQMKEEKEREEMEKSKQDEEEEEEDKEEDQVNEEGKEKSDFVDHLSNENKPQEQLPVDKNESQNDIKNEVKLPDIHAEDLHSPTKNHDMWDSQKGIVIHKEYNKQQVVDEIKIYKEEKNGYTNEINRAQEQNDPSVTKI